jgi:hypothetical protein
MSRKARLHRETDDGGTEHGGGLVDSAHQTGVHPRLLNDILAERLLLALLWAVPGILVMLFEQAGLFPATLRGVPTSVLVLILSVFGFMRFGGDWLLPSTVFHLGCGIFVGFAGLALAGEGLWVDERVNGIALSVLYIVQCWTLLLPARPVRRTTNWPTPLGLAPKHVFLAGVLMVVGALTAMTQPGLGGLVLGPAATFVPSIAFVGLVLIAVNNFLVSRNAIVIGILGMSAFCAAYFQFGFDGFGRMTLGTIGIALSVVLAVRYGRLVKVGVILGIPVALVFLAAYRAAVSRAINVNSRESGFESVVSALGVYVRMFAASVNAALPLQWGDSYVSALLVLVPRSVWAGKPDLLGKEVVAFVSPSLVDTTHSVAAMLFGEWIWNFGVPGLIVTIPVGILLLGVLDRITVSWLSSTAGGWSWTLHIAAAATLSASMLDLIWGGSSAFATRDMLRLILIGLMGVVLVWLPRMLRPGPSRPLEQPGHPTSHHRPGNAVAAGPRPARSGPTYPQGVESEWRREHAHPRPGHRG